MAWDNRDLWQLAGDWGAGRKEECAAGICGVGKWGMERCGSVARSSPSVSAAYKQIRKYHPKNRLVQPLYARIWTSLNTGTGLRSLRQNSCPSSHRSTPGLSRYR